MEASVSNHVWSIEDTVGLPGGEMTNSSVTLSRQQLSEMFKAISGIGNVLKGLASKPGNASEVYAIMSNLSIIQANLAKMPRVNTN